MYNGDKKYNLSYPPLYKIPNTCLKLGGLDMKFYDKILSNWPNRCKAAVAPKFGKKGSFVVSTNNYLVLAIWIWACFITQGEVWIYLV